MQYRSTTSAKNSFADCESRGVGKAASVVAISVFMYHVQVHKKGEALFTYLCCMHSTALWLYNVTNVIQKASLFAVCMCVLFCTVP